MKLLNKWGFFNNTGAVGNLNESYASLSYSDRLKGPFKLMPYNHLLICKEVYVGKGISAMLALSMHISNVTHLPKW